MEVSTAELTERAGRFRALHERPGTFILPNPWDAGTARLLEVSGFAALATTGAGYAFSTGRRDGTVPRPEMLDHIRTLVAATTLPISADLEDGYGDDPAVVAETIRAAAAAGAVGGSIEDRAYRSEHRGLYELDHAVERIQAAVEAKNSLPFPFTLTARCETYLVGRPSLDDSIRRLQAYEQAGADVLYAPGVVSRAEIKTLVAALDRPVNVVMGLVGDPMSCAELAEIGVKRISLGSTLARVALGALIRAADELQTTGTFSFASDAIDYARLTESLDR